MNETYKKDLACIEQLCITACTLSKNTSGKSMDKWEIAEVTSIFHRICLTSIALLKLLPYSCYYSLLPDPELWDLPSVATLTRSLIETYHAFFYIAIEKISDEESTFRKMLWEYHDICQRYRMLKFNPIKSPNIHIIEKLKQELKEKLINNTYFAKLEPWLIKELKKGRKGIYLNNRIISERAKINPNFYSMVFTYCSNHVHTSSLSTSHLSSFRADDSNSLELFSALMDCMIGYLSVSIRDFLHLFPNQQKHVPPKVLGTIDEWQDIFKFKMCELNDK